MKPITEELITEFFGDGRFTRDGNRWTVVTEHGRVFKFDDKWFDLSQCLTPLVAGETKEDREESMFAACFFCRDVWGCVDVRRLPWIKMGWIGGYARGYKFAVDDDRFRPFGISDAIAVFGDTAKVGGNGFGVGWRITVPDVGFVVIGLSGAKINVRRIEGNLYEAALRFMENMQGHAIVRGKRAFCSTCLVYGEILGIRVIPEVPRGFLTILAIQNVAFLPILAIGWGIALAFPTVRLGQLIAAGWLLLSLIGYLSLGDERKRGRALLNQFPGVQTRHAEIDEARERGMLL
jgi:hypothetical protein